MKRAFLLIALLFILFRCAPVLVKKLPYKVEHLPERVQKAYVQMHKFLEHTKESEIPVRISSYARIDTILYDRKHNHFDIYFNRAFAHMPFREDNTRDLYWATGQYLDRAFDDYTFTLYALEQPIKQLIPNYYRSDSTAYDRSRMPSEDVRPQPLVRRISRPFRSSKGLYNHYIALWHSHGWYYEQKYDRWEWQRARVFETVEDLFPMSFTLPYLVPMLENAGAQVFLPRERDTQRNEVLVDNDGSTASSVYEELGGSWMDSDTVGFAIGNPPYKSGTNPFKLGSFKRTEASSKGEKRIRWIPDIPKSGRYAVYISYARSDSSISDAHYTVHHLGGKSAFLVNQSIGGPTWIFLGKFNFEAGIHPESGSVVLSNRSDEAGKMVTADAVRFGGGMGNIARNGKTSGRPRFTEGARYYLQYAGMPDTLVYNLNEDTLDYNDDYQSRGEWVNYLKGAPYGPNRDRQVDGLGLPIDLSLAFHTDAGTSRSDTVIGTLGIYSSTGGDTTRAFPDSMSRWANRDFMDILQTQIVEDIRAEYDSIWTRRPLWDRRYSEAYRPNVPAALLELLSHQNFLDMKFGLDPRFRFDVSRSIYKAMLRFLATQYQYDYVVQPLPVDHFSAEMSGPYEVTLNWRPVSDPLEPTADPESYIVYTRKEGSAFDNGVVVNRPRYTMKNLEPGVIYSFKVTAVNAGGESFPSEILSVCSLDGDQPPVCIINGFDRVAPPATLETEKYIGFADFWDQGVPDKVNMNYIGRQYDYNPESAWLDDDAPGHGASYANYETKLIAGNTFDFPYMHGQSIRAAGFSFVSTSDEAVMDGAFDLNRYPYVDLILGEEKTTPGPKSDKEPEFHTFPEPLRNEIKEYCRNGNHLFISGAYVGSDLWETDRDSVNIQFAFNDLKFFFRTDYAVTTGDIHTVDTLFFPASDTLDFNTKLGPDVYAVEAPDAIEPADSLARTILRYSENNTSAGVAYKGNYDVVVLGFPFESVLGITQRDELMRAIFNFFRRTQKVRVSLFQE